ncbi:hypothetical protein HPB48_009298 [Haemaphysalis longicornis]|uniref:G-protein coupled receptors family 1 profile domain-containing protein n=1 Tax=Haemaphysalis longicornis TaxID=44386 RepID=A0A9J6H572_HAELO|nr:hypothetical protein HPB48_009298 [Haemaphysalis longicornis]
MCSFALHVRVCQPRGDGISSLEHLLDSVVLRVAVWIVSLVACLGNLLVLVGRLVLREPNAVHSFYIKNLALADLLMGVYLFVIASHDVMFRGEYIRHDFRWRHSVGCSASGLLSTVSSEASVFTLTVITVDRFASIVYPLSIKRRTLRFAWFCMAAVWLLTLLMAAVPMMRPDYYGEDFYGSNGVCLPLHIHDPDSRGIKIDETLYAWVAVFLLPVNSALNPVLYTLTTRLFKQHLNRFLISLRTWERNSSNRQSGHSWSSLQNGRGSKKSIATALSDRLVVEKYKAPNLAKMLWINKRFMAVQLMGMLP